MKYIMLAVAVLLVISSLPVEAEEAPDGDITVLDPYLQEVLVQKRNRDVVEVIIQFHVPFGRVRDAVMATGATVVSEHPTIRGAFLHATKAQVLEISSMKDVKWIEYNVPLTTFMEVSTMAIYASEVWNYGVADDGDLVKGHNGYLERVDGHDVTAVVLDTGIDAGHPDLDYLTKTITNRKREENGWVEVENGDTTSGHGTHCAGTVAGNGDASAGQRRGVAPGANLVGLSTGEGLSIIYALEGLEWTFQESRPDNNPWNIRVVSNSWGTSGGEYDPNNAIAQITERLVFENHVQVVFAAGNDGGDGSDIRTNPYSNTPAAISVAAGARDGSGVASFSSRGLKDKKETWPDIMAPGVDIWSTAPRGTLIDAAQRPSDDDLYYMAISGTSMATPHISGVMALLYQVAPSLGVSEVHDDVTGDGDWNTNNRTLISEAELIIEATANYLLSGEGVPPSANWTNDVGWRHDFAQGYGLVNVSKAVKVAAALERLRTFDKNGDGKADRPDMTVFDALNYLNISYREYKQFKTDTVRTKWSGEWAHFVEQDTHPTGGGVYATNATVMVYLPRGANLMSITFDYESASAVDYYAANLDLAIDLDGDGTNDVTVPTEVSEGVKYYEVPLTEDDTDRYCVFWIDGISIGANVFDEYFEPTVRFTVSLALRLDESTDVFIPYQGSRSDIRWLEPHIDNDAHGGTNTTVWLETRIIDPTRITPSQKPDTIIIEKDAGGVSEELFGLILFISLLLLIIVGILMMKLRNRPVEVEAVPPPPAQPVPVGQPVQPPPEQGQ